MKKNTISAASLARQLDKSWTTLLSMAALCCSLTVLIAFQIIGSRQLPLTGSYLEKIIIPDLVPESSSGRNHYHYALSQIVHRSRKHDFFDGRDLSDLIVRVSLENKVDPIFVAALIREESRFGKTPVSSKGARGLMQLKPSTAQYIARKSGIEYDQQYSLNDPEMNISLGISYLKYLSEEFNGNLNMILAAYNWGPANVRTVGGSFQRLPAVTQRYVRSINSNYSKWKNEFAAMTHGIQA